MKEFIEKAFGIKDSELEGWEYNIPEGYTASIENGKIIVKKEESEDKRIRKELIDFVKSRLAGFPDCKRFTNWLEKQGESSDKIHYWTEEEIEPIISDYLRGAEHYGGMIARLRCLKPKSLEKQGEQKPVDFKAKDWYVSKVDGKIHNMTYNPTDKVEPKFKVGDWITNEEYVWQIDEVKRENYLLIDSEGNLFAEEIAKIDSEFHLWATTDAKDGDVLAFDNDNIVIFKDLYNYTSFHSYCHIEDGIFDFSTDELPDWWEDEGFKPATKEQRDLLFRKMKETGFEWNAEKKKLGKRVIDEGKAEMDYCFTKMMNGEKVSSDLSEDDEEALGWLCTFLKEYGNPFYDGNEENVIDWLKSLKERIQPQPKQEWSEEDEIGLGDALWCCKQARTIAKDENDMGNIWYAEKWLKSLKKRIKGE